MRQLVWLLVCFCLLAPGFAAHAGEMSLPLPNGLVVQAEFRRGAAGKPVVILLHGFLQTHHFPMIRNLAESLADEGYSVLAPTLSLNTPNRNKSMACEAIHSHTVKAGVSELGIWVKWLKARGYRQIVLAGHSLGNVINVAYLLHRPDPAIRKFIGISIMEARLKMPEDSRRALVQQLQTQVATKDRRIVETPFSFCQKFRSTPESILSYMAWGPQQILDGIVKIRVPTTMIMGSQDDRLGPDWTSRLQATHARVIIVNGANHFMDGQYEFDLFEHMRSELKDL